MTNGNDKWRRDRLAAALEIGQAPLCSGEREALAEAAIKWFENESVTLSGQMRDGRPIAVDYKFKGDLFPGYWPDGKRFEGVTSMFQILRADEGEKRARWAEKFKAAVRQPKFSMPPKDFYEDNDYVQVPTSLADRRAEFEIARMEACGIKTASLRLPDGTPFFDPALTGQGG